MMKVRLDMELLNNGLTHAPFNVGVLTQTSLTVPELTITGNVNTSGIITAGSFSGNITGNVTGNVTGNLTGDVTGNARYNNYFRDFKKYSDKTAFSWFLQTSTVEPYVEDDGLQQHLSSLLCR